MDWAVVQEHIDKNWVPEENFLQMIRFLEDRAVASDATEDEKNRAQQALKWLHRSIKERITLPFSDALKISLRNIFIRLGRAAITSAGVFLGIAFFMFVFVSSDAISIAEAGMVGATEQSRQELLVILSLLVSTVGISNSMLMAVTERFKEIGTMKCLGALDGFIIKLFLIESVLMGFFGSLAGALFGFLSGLIIYMIKDGASIAGKLHYAHLGEIMVMGIIVGVVLSAIAAIGPAYRAASLPAAAALRVEV